MLLSFLVVERSSRADLAVVGVAVGVVNILYLKENILKIKFNFFILIKNLVKIKKLS